MRDRSRTLHCSMFYFPSGISPPNQLLPARPFGRVRLDRCIRASGLSRVTQIVFDELKQRNRTRASGLERAPSVSRTGHRCAEKFDEGPLFHVSASPAARIFSRKPPAARHRTSSPHRMPGLCHSTWLAAGRDKAAGSWPHLLWDYPRCISWR